MKPLHVFCGCCPLAWMALLLGCGGPEKAPVVKQSGPAKVEKLAELGDLIGPLDEGRIEVAPPKGWHVPPRDKKWVVRFMASKNSSYPSIFLTAEDYQNVRDVSKANVEAFAQQISTILSQDKKTARLSQAIEPVEAGSLVGITYQRQAKTTDGFKEIVLDRLFLETVVAGRKYCFELRARTGTLDKYRPHLMGVATGIKFLDR